MQGPIPYLVIVALIYLALVWLMNLKNKGMEDYLNDLAESDPERLELETSLFQSLSPNGRRIRFFAANQIAHFISYKIDWVAYVLLSEDALNPE
jgi:hypothetical protein